MKKSTIELYRQKNCWLGYGFAPWVLHDKGINVDDKVMEWANQNNAFVYKHYTEENNYPYDPPKYEHDHKYSINHQLCDKTIELVIYYESKDEVPIELCQLAEATQKLKEWAEACNQN